MNKKRKKLTEEHKRKISKTLKGRFKGRKLSEETKKKISDTHKGKKQSQEHIRRKVEANKGQKRTEETKRKISRANKGNKHSKEVKRKMSEIAKGKYKREKNPNWGGGKYKDKDSYILVLCPTHPYCDSKGYVREHRLKVEAHIGRVLLPTEIVHHIGDKTDNRIENLMLFSNQSEHIKYHRRLNKNDKCN